MLGALDRRGPGRTAAAGRPGASARSAATLRGELGEHVVLAGVVPVDPAQLVVLAVDVVVALLGAAQLVAVRDHRHALGQQQRGEEVALLPLAQRVRSRGRRSGPRRRSSRTGCGSRRRGCPRRWPRCASRCRRPGRARVNPSCAVTKLIDAIGRRPSTSYRSDEPVKRDGELAEAGRLAAPEVAHGVAVLAVPLRPQRREAADLVAALADVPRLGDQLDLADDRVLVDQVEERGQPVDLVELPGQRGGQVEPEPVDVHLGDPVPQRVHDQPQRLVVADVEAVAGAGGVVVVAAGRRRPAGSRPGCRCRGTTASGPGGCPRRCGCRRRRGSPRCRPGAAP